MGWTETRSIHYRILCFHISFGTIRHTTEASWGMRVKDVQVHVYGHVYGHFCKYVYGHVDVHVYVHVYIHVHVHDRARGETPAEHDTLNAM